MTTKVPIELSSTPSIVDGGNATAITIDSSENVLIGASSANTGGFGSVSPQLLVSGTMPQIALHETDNDKDGYIGIQGSTMFIQTADAIPMRFATSDTERLRITSAGKVGVGSSDPQTKFVVAHTDGGIGIEFSMGDPVSFIQCYNRTSNDYASLSIDGEDIRFRTNDGSERMRVGSNGNISIGTTTTDRELKVQKGSDHSIIAAVSGTSNLAGIVMGDTDDDDIGHILYNNSNNSMSFRTNTSDRMTIDASGELFLNTTSAMDNCFVSLQDHSNGEAFLGISSKDDNNVGIRFGVGTDRKWVNFRDTDNNLIWYSNAASAERMRILHAGTVLISTSSASGLSNSNSNFGHSFGGGQQVNSTNNDVCLLLNRNLGSGDMLTIRNNGSTIGSISQNGSTITYGGTSDYRLKENVTDMTNATTRLKQLKPKRFNYISDETNTLYDGFLAHEVSSVVPEAVVGEKDAVDDEGNPLWQMMDSAKLIPLLVKGIQELHEQVDALQSEIKTLKGE